jgi:hypothetical protein
VILTKLSKTAVRHIVLDVAKNFQEYVRKVIFLYSVAFNAEIGFCVIKFQK